MQNRNSKNRESGGRASLRTILLPVEDRVNEVLAQHVGPTQVGVDDGEEAVEDRHCQRSNDVSRLDLFLASEDEDVDQDDDGVEAVLVEVGVEPLVVVDRIVEQEPEGKGNDQANGNGDVLKNFCQLFQF